ncbi:endoplasmic reticulum resident protein 44-like isoform X2 [Leptotrombidium deliense]|uniref:Endoplasmic reticulum resident protein 44-like isoform X2 n=1 Tax=Leptotrombidium deliense TaxID=299467 RepID=A0A443SH14_9ACAR|nr:endoplasmic reticulum resident protein 44-like isoform X2 [Leptotrombidium deliense]
MFSRMLAPIYEQSFEKVLSTIPDAKYRVMFTKVNCEVEKSLESKFHVNKYPTLKVIINGTLRETEYRGHRSVDAILEHIKESLKDTLVTLKTEEDKNLTNNAKPAIVSYFESDANELKLIRKIALNNAKHCDFYLINGDLLSKLESRKNSITFKAKDEELGSESEIYVGSKDNYDDLQNWVQRKCISLVTEITFNNAEELTEEGLPLMIMFHKEDDTKSVELYKKTVETELKDLSNTIKFVVADGQKFVFPLLQLGKGMQDLPLIAIDSFAHMYQFKNFDEISIPGKLRQFAEDLNSGKLHLDYHSDDGMQPMQFKVGLQSLEKKDENDVSFESHEEESDTDGPPKSTFVKLMPSSSRYSLKKDEL